MKEQLKFYTPALISGVFITFDFMKELILYIFAIAVGLLLARECNRDKRYDPVIRTITVKVPEVIKQFDTIYKPVPRVIYQTDTIVLREFLSASDSLKIAMYVDATKLREYKEAFEDSNQRIDVFTRVRGELLSQTANYKIFERSINHSDTILLKPTKRSFYLLPSLGFNNQNFEVQASASILYIDRKNRLMSLGYDTNGFLTFGYGIKF